MPVRLSSAAIAEFLGTFALCFVGILAIHHSGTTGGGGLLAVALAHGLILGCVVAAAMPTSGGHLNPAVTIGFFITGKIKPVAALVYIFFQLLGGVVAALAVYVLMSGNAEPLNVVAAGTPQYAGKVSMPVALVAEMVATGLLVFAVWGSAADPRAKNVGGFAIGLTVAADILAIGPLTGAAMNPARAFGPTLVASMSEPSLWPQQMVYWVGPIVGGSIVAVLYHLLLWPRDPQRKIDPDSMQVPPSQRP